MRTLTLATLALATAFGAGIAAANPGLNQIAGTLGVSANDFTAAQLIQLQDAQRDNDDQRIKFILSQAGQGNVSISAKGNTAVSQDIHLAGLAGVAPGQYTVNELQRLIEARRTNDDTLVNFILSGENRKATNPTGTASVGKAQLAAALGVQASDYSLNELVKIQADRFDD